MATGSEGEGQSSIFRFDTRQIVVAGIIGGIALFLGFTRLGFIPVPIPLIGNATIMHIPAIVGGVLEGPIVGMLAGYWPARSASNLPVVEALRTE